MSVINSHQFGLIDYISTKWNHYSQVKNLCEGMDKSNRLIAIWKKNKNQPFNVNNFSTIYNSVGTFRALPLEIKNGEAQMGAYIGNCHLVARLICGIVDWIFGKASLPSFEDFNSSIEELVGLNTSQGILIGKEEDTRYQEFVQVKKTFEFYVKPIKTENYDKATEIIHLEKLDYEASFMDKTTKKIVAKTKLTTVPDYKNRAVAAKELENLGKHNRYCYFEVIDLPICQRYEKLFKEKAPMHIGNFIPNCDNFFLVL